MRWHNGAMSDARFHTTRWSMIVAASHAAGGTSARDALEHLCRAYWYPVFAFIRRRGHGQDEALDLTQGYFASLLERGLLEAADRERGRFRSFLLATVKQFLSDERKRAAALKRGGAIDFVSLDAASFEEGRRAEIAGGQSPEAAFEQQWALTVFHRAKRALATEFEKAGKSDQFNALQGHLSGDHGPRTHAEIAGDLETTEGAVKMAVKRLRHRFGQLLREEIAQTLVQDGDLDEEVRHLLDVL